MKNNLFTQKSQIRSALFGFLITATAFSVQAQYTLTDNDVVVTNGVITSCSYSFGIKNIIIPQTLDGQTVTGIANASYSSAGVFYYKGIISVQLPVTLKNIGDYAFYNNAITSLNLSGCTALTNIGTSSFNYNKIASLNLSGCTALLTIGESAFYNNKLTSLDLSPCKALSSIGPSAFYYNLLTTLDITGCKSLINIGSSAFSSNSSLKGFVLPEVTFKGTVFNTWEDGTGKSYAAGVDQATNFTTFYLPLIPYTLTDDDVIVENGIIKSCSYNFELKNIIIPQTLDGQTVTGIANASYTSAGVFYYKGITTVQLPVTLKTIGDYAFYDNSLTKLNIANCTSLNSVGKYAFYSNDLASLDLSACTALTIIDANSFYYNKLASLNLSGCTALLTIGESAFGSNKLTSLDLSPCKALSSIGPSAFYYNLLTTLDITGCKSLINIGSSAFSSNSSLKGFALPEVTYKGTVFKTWEDGTGKSYTAGVDQATNLNTFYLPLIPYTLTDNDVVVENGIIKSCSYTFELKNIIIPQTLDGQTVTGIATGSYSSAGVFYYKGIISVQLPVTIQTIGDNAFYDNSITKLNIANCTSLNSVGKYAFYSNDLASLDLSACTALTIIDANSFNYNKIASLNLSGCTALLTIGESAFYNNKLTSLDLSPCKALSSIGPSAFYYNLLTTLDITGCKSLINIGSSAFSSNSSLKGFVLPEVTFKGTVFNTWEDGTGKSYAAGVDQATNFTTFYLPLIPYTLTDDDVIVENGIIKSCSYNFELKNIIIPQTLDGQTVTGIANASYTSAGVFYYKGITTVQLPVTLKTIGDYAFYDNSLTKLNIANCTSLNSVGKYAFYSNDLASLDLSACTALTIIDANSFYYNKLASLNLSGCTALLTIGESAFGSNKLTSLDLSPCKALSSIGPSAFYYNLLTTLDITGCKSLINIGSSAFSSNSSLKGFALPEVTYKGTVFKTWEDGTGKSYTAGVDQATNLNTFYLPLIPYTLTDNDVVVENGIIKSCSYTFELKNIIIPQTLDGQTVTGIATGSYSSAGVFYYKGIISVQLPVTIQTIGDNAFYDNSITKLNIANCTSLNSVGKYAFYSNDLASLDLSTCTALTIIDANSFYYNKLASLNLSGCTALLTIGESAFSNNKITSLDLSPCKALSSIGPSAFYYNLLTTLDITGCKSLINIGSSAFSSNSSLKGFALPEVTYKGTVFKTWEDGTGKSYTAGVDQATNLNTFYLPLIPYTLTDDDVIVENGIIKSCSYTFELKNIIIPQTLDGQTVTGIANASYTSAGVFYYKGITTVQLPVTLKTIGDYAFYDNSITKLNIANCTSLNSVGKYAFYSNDLASINLSDCKALTTIGAYAFSSNLLTGFMLPDPGIPGYILNQWVDDAGVKYNAGSLVTNFNTRYSAKMMQFCKNNFFAKSLNNSQPININLVFSCPGRGMEIANVAFDNNKFVLNMTLPLIVASGDTSFSLPLKLNNPETKLFITRYEVTYKMDGQTKTNSDNLNVATIIEDNSELSIVGKRAIEAYNSSLDSNQVATLNNRGVIYRLLGYPDLAKPLFDNAVSLGLSKFYAFTGIKMNQGVVESDMKKSTDANTIYENALSDIGAKKDSSVLAPQIFYNQAWEFYMNENYTGAESLALKTLNHTKANAWLKAKAAALLGAIKYNKGDKEGAVVAFQTAYTIDSNGPIGIMARENIQLITASDDLSNETGFQVYPQPANNYLIIECKGKSLQKVNIELSDLSGKVVYSCQSYPSGSGFYHFVDVNNFPGGMYNLKLVSGGLMQVFKIIVQ